VRTDTTPVRLAVAGALAAAGALATGELVSSVLPDTPSLVGSVGDAFIDGPGKTIAKPAIELLGTADKPALVVGIVVVALVLGAVAGVSSARRPGAGPLAFGVAGVAGAAAAMTDPVAGTPWAALAALAAAGAGVVLLRSLAGAVTEPDSALVAAPTRRSFVVMAGATGVAALAAGAAAPALRRSGRGERARAAVSLPPARPPAGGATSTVSPGFDVPGLSPYLTPNDRFYRIDTALVTPQIDPADWSLAVTGMVDNPFTLRFDELLALEMTTETVTIACVSNDVGGKLVGNADWQGVPLRSLLERAGVQDGAQQLVGRSVDGFTVGFPVGLALDGRTAMVAVGMNGEPLPVDHGFPARLIVEGVYGYVSATKWLTELELTTWDGFDAYWIPRGWAKQAPVKTQSRIDVPTSRTALSPGAVAVAGVAWAPGRGISRVEVQVDDGEWRDADLGPAASDATWRQWRYRWDATEGEHELRVRATDGAGEAQTGERRPAAPDGATGWHTRRVRVLSR
jgi:DMSO/TMAO reductase YedYZ molybdopterin-dependent catalytic subunit